MREERSAPSATSGPAHVAPSLSATVLYAGRRLRVGAEGITIGRDSENDIALSGDLVSRRHARIHVAEGRCWVSDLGSRNGTNLNGERLVGETRALTNGDSVSIGGELLRILTGEETRTASRQLPIFGTQIVKFTGERLSIGRDRSNDVVLDDPNVSRFHAEVRVDGERIELVDLWSRNGTRVDGRLVERATLRTGSEFGIGPFRLIFDGSNFLARDDRGALRLDARGVAVRVDGKQILARTSLAVEPGELVAVIGESGSGKTTLMRALTGVTVPSEGSVTVNGEPVRFRLTDIGFVPQEEIIHARLTVLEALRYAARLRLPADATQGEIDVAVRRVLEELALAEHRHTRIESLSGGQRKRVSVAVELVNSPGLLFLDEPTTGLDPGLESRMMALLRELADNARAVAVVTHATKNLDLCDKLVVMGRGGECAFRGRPDDALHFFRVSGYDAIYTALDERPATEWRHRFEAAEGSEPAPEATQLSVGAEAVAPAPRLRPRRVGPHVRVLTRRYLRLLFRDRRNLLILLGQVPILGLALVGMFEANVFAADGEPNQAAQLIFLLITTAIWLGSIDAAREVIKERNVLVREAAVGVRLSAYLLSKVLVLFALAAFQTALLSAIVLVFRPLHEPVEAYQQVLVTLVLTSFVAVAMGLLISTLVKSEDQATSFIPLALIPQLLFAGAIVPIARLSEPIASISELAFAQWSFAGCGTAIDMNARIAADPEFAKVSTFGTSFFDVSASSAYLTLAAFLAVFIGGVAILLRRQSR
jgi:ABC-type multidrug transport system ATPase subunit/pSer/pThr/pTyr-binding forkhead associated (FHA) protein